MIKKMSIVDVMFGINQKINNYYLAKLAVSSFLYPYTSKEDKTIEYMAKLCISFSTDIYKLTEELQMKPPDANKIIELYYFSMFVICMAYYEIKNIKIFYPLVKMNRTVRGLGGRVIWHIVNKYREGNWTAIWHDPLPIGYLKMKEYEKYFPDGTNYMFDLLYVSYLSGGLHYNEKEYTKYEEDNESFSLRMTELYHQFYANCLDTFELFK